HHAGEGVCGHSLFADGHLPTGLCGNAIWHVSYPSRLCLFLRRSPRRPGDGNLDDDCFKLRHVFDMDAIAGASPSAVTLVVYADGDPTAERRRRRKQQPDRTTLVCTYIILGESHNANVPGL
ncbi:MAG TPA: hypothetical protein VJZ91_14405, partial [Blastocatellia bacterium]|nr:hypothetical protein [Blastocatellia bacterium]